MLEQTLTARLLQRFPALCIPRAADSHKGSHGNAFLIGGAAGMSGALALAATAALYLGSGKTYALFCQARLPLPFFPDYPEILLATAADFRRLPPAQAVGIGCGMGQSSAARHLLAALFRRLHIPLVLDADALHLLARSSVLQQAATDYDAPLILTPHPGEAAHLLDGNNHTIQAAREHSARTLATRFRAWVVLKGQYSLIAAPDGTVSENDSGNAGLAAGGSGDVLTGMLTALLAQGIAVEIAVPGAVWLHGAAAEILGGGRALTGLLAGEIAPVARTLRHRATAENNR